MVSVLEEQEIAKRAAPVTAILGPTNTGKTYLAIERMLAHRSGVIGLPLRLLAREVYQRVVEKVGASRVALITGEERIKPLNPDYWVATVEAMPSDIQVEFAAIDEIQLAADTHRGHIFTNRLLNYRGKYETLLLGAMTVRPLIENLLPRANIVTRSRFSVLSYGGSKKLSRLPARTAIIAFSAAQVYRIAEFIKQQKGGAAVILGALSPRTRNAQVSLYQSGEVDYFVATDAVGMGLNLDVDHVAFAELTKFDGFHSRPLHLAEMAQIAGRAGRYQKDGTFGVTGNLDPLDSPVINKLENHDFPAEKVLQWRNSDLEFSSLDALLKSLDQIPERPGLTRALESEDKRALVHLSRQDEIIKAATSSARIKILWDVCQLPDYNKISPAYHSQIIEKVYGFVIGGGKIDNDWFDKQLKRCENSHGDIDALSARLADVRTWSYLANHEDWLDLSEGWLQRTREIEDLLSDKLHECLTRKFVDRKTSVLMRRLKEKVQLEVVFDKEGRVSIDDELVGTLKGFSFYAEPGALGPAKQAIGEVVQKAARSELASRIDQFVKAAEPSLTLTSLGELLLQGDLVGRLKKGADLYRPEVEIVIDDLVDTGLRDQAKARLETWLTKEISDKLGKLVELASSEGLEPGERGIAHQIGENLGILDRRPVQAELKALDLEGRRRLRYKGVKIGAFHLFMPLLQKPAARRLALILGALAGKVNFGQVAVMHQLALAGRTSVTIDAASTPSEYHLAGFKAFKTRAVRVDVLERLADLIRPLSMWKAESGEPRPEGAVTGGFIVLPSMVSLLGCSYDDMSDVLTELGYRRDSRLKAELADQLPQEPEKTAGKSEAAAVEVLENAPPEDSAETAPEAKTETTPEALVEASSEAPPRVSAYPLRAPASPLRAIPPAEVTPEGPAEVTPEASAEVTPEAPKETAPPTDAASEDAELRINVWSFRSKSFDRRHQRGAQDGKGSRQKHDSESKPGDKSGRPKKWEGKKWENKKGGPKPGGGRGAHKPASPRPERAPDPNSPFAILQQLKDKK